MTRVTIGLLAVALAAPVAATACEDKKESPETARLDAGGGTDKYATADPRLTKALQAAASATADDDGPPPDGVFAAGVADHRHPKGAPTKVEMIAAGSAPKVTLAPAADAGADSARASSYGPCALELAQQMGQRVALPTIDFGFALGPAKKADGGADWLVADIKSAVPAHEQIGQLPPGMDKDIATLQGTQIRLGLTPDGRAGAPALALGKSARPELDRIAESAAEALVMSTVPLPPVPVGVGAQWIAETRMPLSGVDVIAYRAYRVKSIDGDRVHLTLDVKAYAADANVQLAGLPAGASLEQFDTESQGELELVRGEVLARKSDVQQRLVMIFSPPGGEKQGLQGGPGGSGRQLTLQVVSQATLVRGQDLRQAAASRR